MERYLRFFQKSSQGSKRQPTTRRIPEGELYRIKGPVLWYLALLILYTLLSFTALSLVSRGPAISSSRRVLATGSLVVDQLYSGFFLSALLAPAGLLVRLAGNELTLRHPFAVASSSPISIADFDRIADPGPLAAKTIFKYSKWRAAVQGILMATGWLLVPIGTLILTTGSYLPRTLGQSLVSLPTQTGTVAPLHAVMNPNATNGTFSPSLDSTDSFLEMATAVFRGNLISRTEQLPDIPSEIGSTPSLAISFQTGVTYQNIVTFSWDGGCQDARGDINFDIQGSNGVQNITLAFPDNSTKQVTLERGDLTKAARINLWQLGHANTTPDTKLPHGGITYFAVTSLANTSITYNYGFPSSDSTYQDGLELDSDVWIARVKCENTLTWRIASCTWDGTFMRNCTKSPDHIVAGLDLDTVGLNALTQYMTAISWRLYSTGDIMFTLTPFPDFSPTVQHFNRIAGIIALSITTVTSMISWGSALVPTIGEPMRQVYIVRVNILIVVTLLLFTATMLVITDLLYNLATKRPFQKTTFISIATAARGAWWDSQLHGGCGMKTKEVKRQASARIMFGFNVENKGFIGLAPKVYDWKQDLAYSRVK